MKDNDQPYSRSRKDKNKWLDYSKVDWERLHNKLEELPHGQKRPVLIKWALRLRCSIGTLYRGLRKWKRGEVNSDSP